MTTPLRSTATTGGALADALRRSIAAGVWSPGTPLRQNDLAQAYGVSRIPVREALQALQSEGLVVIEPNRGAFVSSLTGEQLTELFDLRMLLEADALTRAVPRHTPRSLRALDALQRELDHAEQAVDWARLDREFHDELYAPCARPRTLGLIANLRASVERFYLARLTPQARRPGWNDEHQLLLAAVQAGRAEDAVAVLRTHLGETLQLALSALAPAAAES